MRGWVLLAVALGLCAAALPACFSPQQPACAFSCARDGLCPPGYVCGGDGLCHRADGVGHCLLTPADAGDAGADGDASAAP
jgi:hypothetical protein